MNYTEYKLLFEEILNNPHPTAPYDSPDYIDYTKLNWSRVKRWDKHLQLSNELIATLKSITSPQHWIIITEPWCGDAAHIVPFLVRMAEQNSAISYDLQLRDAPESLIDQYLTNGGKSIPKLIVRDSVGNDLFVWGPRPAKAQQVMVDLKNENAEFEKIKITLQNWYNEDKGALICKEINEALKAV